MSTREARENATEDNARNTAILKDLMNRPENKVCADCTEPAPKWASWNLGVFLCIQCSGIHRRLGVHISKVRSVSLDKWRTDWIESMQNGGNSKFNKEWEYHLPPNFAKLSSSSAAIEMFIRDKYETEMWRKKSRLPTNPAKEVQKYLDAELQAAAGGGGGGMSEMSYMSQSTSSYQYSSGGNSSGFKTSNSAKYQGFGSNGQTHKADSDDVLAKAMSSLSSGWTTFSSVTSEYASIAAERGRELGSIAAEKTMELSETINDKVIAPTRDRLNEGDLFCAVTTSLKNVSRKMSKGLKSSNNDSDFFEANGLSQDDVDRSISGKDDFFSGIQNRNAGRSSSLPPSQGGKYGGFGSSSYNNNDIDRSVSEKDSFFSGLQSKNSSRSADLPPSKGGKYAGFGPGSFNTTSSGNNNGSCDTTTTRSLSKTKAKPKPRSKSNAKKDDWDWGSGEEDNDDDEEEVVKKKDVKQPTRSTPKSKPVPKAKAKTKPKTKSDDDWDADW